MKLGFAMADALAQASAHIIVHGLEHDDIIGQACRDMTTRNAVYVLPAPCPRLPFSENCEIAVDWSMTVEPDERGGLQERQPTAISWQSRTSLRSYLDATSSLVAAPSAQALTAKGIDTIDCPVSSGAGDATRSTLASMTAGARSGFNGMLPIFMYWASRFRGGASAPGEAQNTKVLSNLVSVSALSITSDAIEAKAERDPDLMLKVIGGGLGRTNASKTQFKICIEPPIRFRLCHGFVGRGWRRGTSTKANA